MLVAMIVNDSIHSIEADSFSRCASPRGLSTISGVMFSMRQSTLHGLIAIFFLLFTAADLTVPHCCSYVIEDLNLSAADVAGFSTDTTNDVTPSITADDSRPDQSSHTEQADGDCFCCCSHILPSVHFSVEELHEKLPVIALANFALPTPTPQSQFRPPRLA